MDVGKTWTSVASHGKVVLFANYIADRNKIDAAVCHVITAPETDRQKKTTDSRCFIFVVVFRLRNWFIEGMDGWSSVWINLLLILTGNTFGSVYPTQVQSGKIISERKTDEVWKQCEDRTQHR